MAQSRLLQLASGWRCPAAQGFMCTAWASLQKRNLMYVRYVPLTKPGETDTEE